MVTAIFGEPPAYRRMPKHASSIVIATLSHCRFMPGVAATAGPLIEMAQAVEILRGPIWTTHSLSQFLASSRAPGDLVILSQMPTHHALVLRVWEAVNVERDLAGVLAAVAMSLRWWCHSRRSALYRSKARGTIFMPCTLWVRRRNRWPKTSCTKWPARLYGWCGRAIS